MFARGGSGIGGAPPRGGPDGSSPDEAGFAAVDAAVALVMLSTTVVLSLNGLQAARNLANAAVETRRASSLMQYVLETAPREIGAVNGQADGFAWSIETASSPGSAVGPLQICDRSVQVRSLASGRRFSLAGAEVCPVPPAS